MKKLVLLFTLILGLLLPGASFAAGEEVYDVPVQLKKYGEIDKDSMGNPALKHIARVVEKDGKAIYDIQMKKMEFMSMEGELTNLFIYDGDKDSNRSETKKTPIQGEYCKNHEFVRPNLKEDKILVAVWVDAMDALQGGAKGAGEQKAYLVFDWAKAKKVSETLSQQPVKALPKATGGIKIVVNGKTLTPDVAPYAENGRTLVPIRFISEALRTKVDWDGAKQEVTIGDKLLVLKLNSKSYLAQGKEKTLDVPASAKQGRTFVPLRLISENLGAKVDWDGASQTVTITK